MEILPYPDVDKFVDYVDVALKKMTERMRKNSYILLLNDKYGHIKSYYISF